MRKPLRLRRAATALVPLPVDIAALTEPAPIVRQVEDPLRCRCPECVMLDRMFPWQGYQLALFTYEISRSRS